MRTKPIPVRVFMYRMCVCMYVCMRVYVFAYICMYART